MKQLYKIYNCSSNQHNAKDRITKRKKNATRNIKSYLHHLIERKMNPKQYHAFDEISFASSEHLHYRFARMVNASGSQFQYSPALVQAAKWKTHVEVFTKINTRGVSNSFTIKQINQTINMKLKQKFLFVFGIKHTISARYAYTCLKEEMSKREKGYKN